MGGLALVVAAYVGVHCAIFYLLFRHWIFGALALTPALVVFLCAIFFRQFDLNQAIIASLFGTVCAFAFGDQLARGVSAGYDRRALASEITRLVTSVVFPVVAAYALGLVAEGLVVRSWEICAQSVLFFASGFIAAFGAARLSVFHPFSERFVARANAAREWREWFLEQSFPPMQPRWAFSVTGIALILGVLAAFGIRDAHLERTSQLSVCTAISLVFLAAGFVATARDWRIAAALTLAASFDEVLLCWALAQHDRFLDPFTIDAALVLSCLPLCLTAACARTYLQDGDDIASALSLAIRDVGAAAIALGVVTSLAGFASMMAFFVLSPALVFAVSSMFAALLLFPAAAIAVHTLFPHYRKVDEVFGRR